MRSLPKIIWTISLCWLSSLLIAQNEVIVTPIITPPYSPYLLDYQEKAIVQLQNTTADPLEIKLTGRIEGDNGYVLFTNPNYLPPSPILLGPFESKTIFVVDEAEGFLDRENLETNVSGRLEYSILTTGLLPQGNYTLCVEAREYPGNRLLSATAPAGCIPLIIAYPDPPVLINPECSAVLNQELPFVSWTPPIGNTGAALIAYDLYVVPLQENENAFEAMDRAYSYQAGNPIIIRDILEPFYAWQPQDIPLNSDQTYAVQVVARDLNENTVFVNNGRSQVCTFRTRFPGSEGLGVEVVGPGLVNSFPQAQISGQLLYRYHGRGVNLPIADDPTLGVYEAPSLVDQNQVVPHQPQNYNQPILIDPYPINPADAHPLANVRVKLVVRYLYQLPHYPNEDPKYLYSKYGNSTSGAMPSQGPQAPIFSPVESIYQNEQVVAVTQTDAEGNYVFDFVHLDSMVDMGTYFDGVGVAWNLSKPEIEAIDNGTIDINTNWSSFNYTGLYKVFCIEIESPFYCSPDMGVMVQPNQSVELPPLVSLVKSYGLTVETKASSTVQEQQATAGSSLNSMVVEILRKENDPATATVPAVEGQNLQEIESSHGGAYRLISRMETNLDGKASFKNLVKHPISTTGKYLVRARSKESYTAYSYQTTTASFPAGDGYVYQYAPIQGPYVHMNGIHPVDPNAGYNQATVFNSEYEVPNFDLTLTMEPDEPVVFGRVVHDIVGLHNVLVELWQNGQVVASTLTGTYGYYEFRELAPGHNYQLKFHRYGYASKTHPPSVFSLQMGTFKDFGEIELQPLGSVVGFVENEDGEAVMADVRIADSPWYPTELVNSASLNLPPTAPNSAPQFADINGQLVEIPQNAIFSFQAQSGFNLKLVIDPYSDQYFRDTFLVNIPTSNGSDHYVGTFTVKEKLHRPRFKITNENGGPVIGATVHVQELSVTTGRTGVAAAIFASPATEFLVRIDPPEGSLLVPYQEILNIPVTKDYLDFNIKLNQGASISGVVTTGPDSIPLAGARVFLDDYLHFGYQLPVIETTTNEQGAYTLSGLPVEFLSTAAGGQVPVGLIIRAVKSEAGSAYIGDEKTVYVPVNGPVNFHLQQLDNTDLSKIWGFPVEIEHLESQGNNQYLISGALVDLPGNTNFQALLPESRLDFVNVSINLVAGTQGLQVPQPVNEQIPLDANALPVRIQQDFQGSLTPMFATGASTLLLQKGTQNIGKIEGKVAMDLASFAFSYNYTGQLFVANTPEEVNVPVFYGQGQGYPNRSFPVVTIGNDNRVGEHVKNPNFWVHDFVATADRYQSYLHQDTVALFTILHTNIQDTEPKDLKIAAGYIHILPNDILSFESGDPLSFQLEAWTIESQGGWYFDKNYGGLFFSKATVKTGALNVPIGNMIIRYDDLDVGEINIGGRTGGQLTLGGVANLKVLGGTPSFYWDPKVPTDLKGHWRIKLSGDENQPAAQTNIPEFQPGQITFNSFSLISNGEEYLTVSPQTVWIYEVLEFQMHGILVETGYFTLTGQADLHIPEVAGNAAVFHFSKPGNDIVMEFDNFNVNFMGIGKVDFSYDNYVGSQTFTQGLFSALGTLTASDDLGNNIQLKAKLIRTPTSCLVDIIQVNQQNQKIVCGQQGSNYLEVTQGAMVANLNANTWNNFEFDAYPRSNKGFEPNPDILHFVVYGAIEATNSTIQVSDMSTAFGNLVLKYNLVDHSLNANLHITQDIPLGTVTITEANVNFLMSDKGFYFMLAASGTIPVIQEIDFITLIGHYSQFDPSMEAIWDEYSLQSIPETFANGFSGFIINVLWTPVDASTSIGIIDVVSLDFYASVNVEVRLYADFGEGEYLFSILGRGEFMLAFTGPCITTGVGVVIEVLLSMKISSGDFLMEGCASVSLFGFYEACLPIIAPPLPPDCSGFCAADCWSGGVKVDLKIGESVGGIDFSVDLGGGTCSGIPMAIEKVAEDSGFDCN